MKHFSNCTADSVGTWTTWRKVLRHRFEKDRQSSKKSKWREESSTLFWKHFHFMPRNCHREVLPHFIAPQLAMPAFRRIGLPQYVPCRWICVNLSTVSNTFSLQGTSALPEWLRRYGNISWHWGRRFHLKDWIEDLLSCWNWFVEKIQISSNLWVSMPP